MYQTVLVFGAAFLGSAVESTEALTIVLAVGLTRGWRAPLLGTLAALVALAVLVIFFGQLIVTRIPELQGAATGRDWVGFVLALKGVFLEGLEVVFIVIAVGGTGRGLPAAVAGGLLAMVVVAVAGVVVRRPLARVPENTLKYAVGVILTSLGTFWAAEGMGASWPLDFVSILGLAVIYFAASRLAVVLIRRPALA